MRRPGGADFAPGAYVFPGGTVHRDDAGWPDEIAGAAVRELFEEMGILLARKPHPGPLQQVERGPGRFARERDCEQVRSLVADGRTFREALLSSGLEPAFDRLVLHARWVTPAQLKRRYDARFYLARLPAGQTVKAQEGEVTDWLWITPARALSDPDITLVYATRTVLESVATAEDASTVLARARRTRDVPIVEPRLVQTASGWEIVRD